MSQYGMGRGAMLSKMVHNYSLVGAEKGDKNSQQSSAGSSLITPDQLLTSMERHSNESNENNVGRFHEVEEEENARFNLLTDKEVEELSAQTNSSTVKKPESQEDIDWQIYKYSRKIKDILKNVCDENFGIVYKQLQDMLEERQLSSRFADCSEVKQFLDVIINKAAQEKEFLLYAACLIKMVHCQCNVEFKKHFPEVIDGKRKEVIQVCASDMLLSNSASHFCQMLGQLMAMPRHPDTKLYDIIYPLVEECVERWSLPEGTAEAEFEGYSLSLAAVKAEALCRLVKEISFQMIDCDRVVEEKMETFVWYLRESVLNPKTPRKLREIYLDGLIEVQTRKEKPEHDVGYYVSLPGHSTSEMTGVEVNYIYEHVPAEETSGLVLESGEAEKYTEEDYTKNNFDGNNDDDDDDDDDDDVVIESEENIEEANADDNHPELEMLVEEEGQIQEEEPYFVIKYILKTLEMEDLLPIFTKHEIQDATLKSLNHSDVMATLKATNIGRMVIFNIDALMKNKGFDQLRKEALDGKTSENVTDLHASSDKASVTVERPKSRSSVSERMAINFKNITSSTPKTGGSVEKTKNIEFSPQQQSLDDSSMQQNDNSDNIGEDEKQDPQNSLYVTAVQEFEDGGSTEGSDGDDDDEVEIEEQYEVFEEEDQQSQRVDSQKAITERSTAPTTMATPTTQTSSISNSNDSSSSESSSGGSFTNNKLSVGRGRGMIRLPNFKHQQNRPASKNPGIIKRNEIPVARIIPSREKLSSRNYCPEEGRNFRQQRRGSPHYPVHKQQHKQHHQQQPAQRQYTQQRQQQQQQLYCPSDESNRSTKDSKGRKSTNTTPTSDSSSRNWRQNMRPTATSDGDTKGTSLQDINSKNKNNNSNKARFQSVYHAKSEPPAKSKTPPRQPAFGGAPPKMCFTCSSRDHMTEECTVVNPFF